MVQRDDINSTAIVIVGVLSTIVVVAVVLGVQTLYYNFERSVVERLATTNALDGEATNLFAEQEARLQREGWLNREEGEVSISIERAMKLVVRELREKQQSEEASRET